MFKFIYHKFTQHNMYKMLSESVEFCRKYDKNILVCVFFGSVYIYTAITSAS